MTDISLLLAQSARGFRAFQSTPAASAFEQSWLDRLYQRLVSASASDSARAWHETQNIARSFVDSGPSRADASPTFGQVVDALQRKAGR